MLTRRFSVLYVGTFDFLMFSLGLHTTLKYIFIHTHGLEHFKIVCFVFLGVVSWCVCAAGFFVNII
jgi:hypothetical protein